MLTPAVLRAFRRRLTNLSSRNRSLLLTSLPGGQFLDLHETDFLLNKPSFCILADLISRKPAITLCDVLDARQERSNEVSRKLRRIDRTARFIQEERGTEDLYVGWPFVRGKFSDGTVIHSPLLFFPVTLLQQGKCWKLARRGDELAFLNPTLALAYGQFNQVKLSDELVEKTADDFDKDPLVFRTQLYEWLKESPLEINFNQDLLTDKLQFFDKQTTKTLEQLERTGELKLYPEAVLGIFPQAGSYLVPDYDTLLKNDELAMTGDAWFGEANNSFSSVGHDPPLLPEKKIYAPLPLDASQEAALQAVKSGQSVVVQGPPGTGKSQLIANLMADAAASGRRVLLVCQKRAALDVVQERLKQVGMAPFLALIHDFQDDRRALYEQIAGQIERIETYRQQNNSLNAVLRERNFEVESQRIDEVVAELQVFKDALFATDECGMSAKELYLTSDSDGPTIPLEDIYHLFRLNQLESFTRRLSDYATYQQRLGSAHPWGNRVSFARFTPLDLTKAEQTIAHWTRTAQVTTQQTAALAGQPLSLAQLTDWPAHEWELTALFTLLDNPDPTLWALIHYLRTNALHPALTTDEAILDQLAVSWHEALLRPGPELSLSTANLPIFQRLLSDALSARSSWGRWTWWQLTNNGKAQLQQVLSVNSLTLSEVDLQLLATKVQKRILLDTIQPQISPLFAGLPVPNVPDSLRLLRRVRQVIERMDTIEPLHQLPTLVWLTQPQFTTIVTKVLAISKMVSEQQVASKTYLTDAQLSQSWEDESYGTLLCQALRRDFDLLTEADRLQEGFSDTERTVIERLSQQPDPDWLATFQNTLRLTWLDHLERQHPQLRSVSSLKMAQLEQALQAGIVAKQAFSQDSLSIKLREQTYRSLSVNRLNNVVTYRDLLHQTTKKRNVWPVRKLMESFADEVFKVVPCWLASPESVSAMFPLRKGLFDLVIFDEASQCFAENGIPAMMRGNQVVVTGDNQQLRPSDLYRIQVDAMEPDDELPAALEVESLLELAAQQLPQVALTEHYRSRSLDLITFSNQHFYQNRLSLLPHFNEINRHEPAIRYLNVNGVWQQNTNPAEAEAVLVLLDQLTTELPGRSIGVVTFNYQQQQLIQDLLDTSPPERRPDGLFIKNIENVQGDERDVIIFSIGYAPDERGRLAMQFGSLTARGGENRLNVAVTRARERVYVVTSLWPDQLTVAGAANEGPKLLKAYLQYALDVSQNRFQPILRSNQALSASSLLKDRLTAQHPDWTAELPFADLTVKENDTYQSLILTDDDRYFQQSVKQAHAYLPIALQARSWPFQRIWSREYWRKTTP